MTVIFILGLSILLQFTAAVLALRLVKVTGRLTAWLFIAIAVFLMAVRRSITFYHLVMGETVSLPIPHAEIVALLISLLMVTGLALISPLFDSIRRSREETEKANRALRMLSECNQTLVRATDEKQFLDEICRIIVDDGGFRLVWVGFAESDEQKSVTPVAHIGFEDGYLENINITWADTERGQGPTGTAIRSCKSVAARHIHTDPNFEPWRSEAVKRGYSSSIALPLCDGGAGIGALNIYAAEPDAFDEREVGFLQELADDKSFGIRTLRARAARKSAEELVVRFGRILEASSNEIYIFDASTLKFLEANRGARENLGYTIDELRNLTPVDIKPEQTEKSFAELIAPLERGESELITFTTTHKRKDGSIYPIEVRMQLYVKEEPPVFVAIVQDITERKEAEEALKESEERFRNIFNDSNDAIFIVDFSQDEIIDANPKACNMLDYSREKLLSIPMSAIHPGEMTKLQAFAWRVLKEGSGWTDELTCKTKSGELIPAEISASLIDIKGKICMLALIRDITERKQAAEALKKKTDLIQLLNEISLAANETSTVEDAMQVCLDKVCDYTRWEVGHAYVLGFEDTLVPTELWHIDDPHRFKAFVEATRSITFTPGVGLPGRVLESGKPVWIPDVTKDRNFLRAKVAVETGLKAGFALPVLEGKKAVEIGRASCRERV